MSMTDEQVIRVLAEREGWKLEYARTWSYGRVFNVYRDGKFEGQWTIEGAHRGGLLNYLASRDALAPVLEKLTLEEKRQLHSVVYEHYLKLNPDKLASVFWGALVTHFLFTLPPPTVAHAVAEAIEGCRAV